MYPDNTRDDVKDIRGHWRMIHRSPQGVTWSAWFHLCCFITLIKARAEGKPSGKTSLDVKDRSTRGHFRTFIRCVFFSVSLTDSDNNWTKWCVCVFVRVNEYLFFVKIHTLTSHVTNTVYYLNMIIILEFKWALLICCIEYDIFI